MVSLLCCLFIYVFYRTEKTLVNQFVIAIMSPDHYFSLKHAVNQVIPLNDYFVYCLPEGLWVYCITLISGYFYIDYGKLRLSLVPLPLLLAGIMELFQLFHLSKGRFDWIDLFFVAGFWLAGLFSISPDVEKQPLFKRFYSGSVLCVASYLIVFLAHVRG